MLLSVRYLLGNIIQVSKKYKKKDFNVVGKNIIMQRGCVVSHPKNMEIGDNVYIGSNCKLYTFGGLLIEQGVVFGSNITVLTANHNFDSDDLLALPYDNRNNSKKVTIKKYAWIGLNSTILPGVKIGEYSVVGAGSVVTKDVPPYSIVGGNPAEIIKYRKKKNYDNLLSWVELNKNDNKYNHYKL